MDGIYAALDKLSDGHAQHMRKSLALLALQDRNVTVLSRLLDDGIDIEEPFEDEVRRVQRKQDPKMHKLLQDYAAHQLGRPWAARRRPRHGHPLNWAK